MKIPFKKTNPKAVLDKFYIVKVIQYCPSGLQIATWNGLKWLTDADDDITEYVTNWVAIDEQIN